MRSVPLIGSVAVAPTSVNVSWRDEYCADIEKFELITPVYCTDTRLCG